MGRFERRRQRKVLKKLFILSSRGREYFIFYERSEIKNLVTRDRISPPPQQIGIQISAKNMEGFLKTNSENKLEKPKIKEGVDFVFEQNPELTEIGTKKQYSEYLETIFPESLVKDILYHGGTLIENDRGKDSFTGELGGKHGLYFTGSKNRARSYIKSGNKEYQERADIHPVILNIKNPLDKKIWSKWKFGLDKISDKEVSIMHEHNADGMVEKDFLSKFTNYNTQYVVLNINQIHILGSKQDVESFKNFVEESKR